MDTLFAVFLVMLTSFVAYQIARPAVWPSAKSITEAVAAFFDWVGIFVITLCTNLALGVVIILMIRGLTPRFVGLYELENFVLVVLSAVQAYVVLRCWKRG
jgi:hypothetical protein